VVHKKGTYAGENEWEQSRLFRSVRNSTAVHKNILPATVTVIVAKHRKLSFLRELDDELLGIVNAGVKNFRGGLPSTIQITASKTAPVIAIYYTVGVQHRNYFEHEVLAQQLSLS